jgi:hypothetical protein
MTNTLGISLPSDFAEGDGHMLERIVAKASASHRSTNPDAIARFRATARLARDL